MGICDQCEETYDDVKPTRVIITPQRIIQQVVKLTKAVNKNDFVS